MRWRGMGRQMEGETFADACVRRMQRLRKRRSKTIYRNGRWKGKGKGMGGEWSLFRRANAEAPHACQIVCRNLSIVYSVGRRLTSVGSISDVGYSWWSPIATASLRLFSSFVRWRCSLRWRGVRTTRYSETVFINQQKWSLPETCTEQKLVSSYTSCIHFRLAIFLKFLVTTTRLCPHSSGPWWRQLGLELSAKPNIYDVGVHNAQLSQAIAEWARWPPAASPDLSVYESKITWHYDLRPRPHDFTFAGWEWSIFHINGALKRLMLNSQFL